MSLPFPVPQAYFPVEHRFLDLDGARIHYVDEGSGKTLLLLHGNPSWSFLYRKMISALKDQFRCVALDYPGHGMSDAPAGYGFTPTEHSAMLERFVERLGLSDLTMMVQDWGGPIGLFAGRSPDLVDGFIIGNTFAWPLNGDRRIEMFSWVLGGPVGAVLTRGFNFVPRFFFGRGLAQHAETKVLDLSKAPWRDPARRRAAVIAPRQLIRSSEYLRQVEANLLKLADRPARIVWDTQDFAFGDRSVRVSSGRSRTTRRSCLPTHRTSCRKMPGSASPKSSWSSTVVSNDSAHFTDVRANLVGIGSPRGPPRGRRALTDDDDRVATTLIWPA